MKKRPIATPPEEPQQTDTGELKPCPFCGGEAKIKATQEGKDLKIWCQCQKCHARTTGYYANTEWENNTMQNIMQSKTNAVEEWNKRYK